MVMRGRVGPEGQAVSVGGAAQIVQDAARLNHTERGGRVNSQNAMLILRKIHHDGDVATLSGQAGAAAAGEDRDVELAGRG